MLTGVSIRGADLLGRNLQALAKRLNRPDDFTLMLANEQSNNVKLGTRKGTDLGGAPFLRLALRSGQPLMDTGKMVAAVHAYQLGGGRAMVALGNTIEARKAVFHQYGTGVYAGSGRILPTGATRQFAKSDRRKKVSRLTRSTGRVLGPMKPGKLFFRSVKGTPPRRWFGFRPGDTTKLREKALLWLTGELMKVAGGQNRAWINLQSQQVTGE